MKKLIALTVAATAYSAVFAQSTSNLYGEVAYTTVTIKDVSQYNLGTYKPTAARFTLGTIVRDNVAVEGFVLQGMSDSSNAVNVNGVTNINVKLKTSYGVAVRPFVNLTKDMELFGRIGSMRVMNDVTLSGGGSSQTDSQKTTYLVHGFGVSYKLNDSLKATIDYTKLPTKEDAQSSIVAVGLRYAF